MIIIILNISTPEKKKKKKQYYNNLFKNSLLKYNKSPYNCFYLFINNK